MRMTKWAVFGLFCALLCGCGGQVKEGIPVVDLGKAVGEIDLKLSDLLENIRVIPLETRPDALLPGHFSTWVGEKYIVTLGYDAIHLFTIDGKYVRKLAERGRGPEEYFDVTGFGVDRQERYCYLASSIGNICVVDLEKGGIARKISTGKNMPLKLWYSDEDSTLVYAPVGRNNLDSDIYRIALDGSLLYAVKKNAESTWVNCPYLWGLNDTIRYKMQFCDTLFLLADTVMIPYCRLVTERPISMVTGCGSTIGILLENKNRLVLGNEEVVNKKEEWGISTFIRPLGYYVLEKSDFSLRKVKEFYVDVFDYTQADLYYFPLEFVGKRAYWNISALKFKELLKDKLDSPLIPEYVKALYARLDEEDNPVLLVGDIK